ncbi:MAG: DUF4390 domain-containing protein [Wenzhouxiangellaceae bacterium]|nr:DUF4390 domain-containing protein [Wenzhouxiangellaceae bacterium]
MAFITCVCAGCGDAGNPEAALSLDPVIEWNDDRLVIETGIEFQPSEAMREALERGVDLELQVLTRVSRRIGPIAHLSEKRSWPIGIHFLPLTEQWQLSLAGYRQTYPRLWLLLDALAEPQVYEPGFSRDFQQRGAWQVQIRVVFNRNALPPPMHLPSLFLRQWRLAEPWHTWQFDRS